MLVERKTRSKALPTSSVKTTTATRLSTACNNDDNDSRNIINNNNNNCYVIKQPIVLATLLLLLQLQMLLMNVSCVAGSRDRSKPAALEAKVGSHVAFNCHIDFPYDSPIPYVVHWSKDNKKIFTWFEGESSTNELFNGRLHMVEKPGQFGQASVNLTSIRESDQGWYHCQIIFPNRTPSVRNNGTWYHLTVQGGSLIKIPPVNQTIMEGQTAFFHCVMKFPESSVATWHKDGVPLQETQELLRRSYMGPDGSLSIDPTMMSDLGEYECNVRSNEGEVQTAKAFLNIQYKAKVIYAPPEVYLPYGQPAVLDCHFRSNPPLKNLRWEKDGLLFDSYNVPGVFYKMNGSLFFSKVDENHAGSYTCTPYNDLGTDGPSPVISVIVLRPPIFSITPKTIYIQKLGEDAELPCEAIDRDGNNRPTIAWSRKDGVPLPEGRYTFEGGNLTITGLVESDRGMYECSATNEAATITAETELMIENIAPRAPYNLTANSSETAITIRWQPGYLRPNLEYTVWYRLVDALEWRTMRILSHNVMEATLQNLQPGREYQLMVLSQDKHGDGMFSKQIRFSTQPAAEAEQVADAGTGTEAATEGEREKEPATRLATAATSSTSDRRVGNKLAGGELRAPRNLSAVANAHGWLLHWQHPLQGAEGGLRVYRVRWWKEPEHMLVGSAETLDDFYQLRHLKEESRFLVQVQATTESDLEDGGIGGGFGGDGDHGSIAELVIEVPSHRKMRALLIGSTVGVLFLVCALCAFLYVKRSCLRHLVSGGGVVVEDEDSEEHMKDVEKMNRA